MHLNFDEWWWMEGRAEHDEWTVVDSEGPTSFLQINLPFHSDSSH